MSAAYVQYFLMIYNREIHEICYGHILGISDLQSCMNKAFDYIYAHVTFSVSSCEETLNFSFLFGPKHSFGYFVEARRIGCFYFIDVLFCYRLHNLQIH
jgi:hypothetical protein